MTMFSFETTPKFVINIASRRDRLDLVSKEFDYMGWDFERFDAVTIGGGEAGCAASHVAVAKLALERKYDHVLVCEDDILFMPWARQTVVELNEELNSVSWYACHLNPSVHRPLTNYYSSRLLDLTNVSPTDNPNHRGIFGSGCMLWTKKACEYVVAYENTSVMANPRHYAIDEYFSRGIYPNIQTVSPLLPLCLQESGYSDVRGENSDAYFVQRYQWNLYAPVSIEGFPTSESVREHRKLVV